ncbi:M20 metallopeptidase family protein [Pseudoalteromonas xiamenensis]|uniref:Amidohydrolase n=1 Tax=Pseudoalteromonas xiamenensis TaxID=882626 RepID=A0A975DG17_9GAMM|nr:amidohydrolase [Pseudoalteromonas xiamenensis]QTH70904.1 amidohydrolase [Pseudoalteromonas xiamenensis]
MKWTMTSLALLVASQTSAATLSAQLDKQLPSLEQLYLHLHQNPELSYHEVQSSKRLADEFKALGMNVTEGVGGHGVVALFQNGEGPTIMIRADTDGLPITEETGKPYASKVTTVNASNQTVGVMHGCGHDIHMTSLVGTAKQLMNNKSLWKGTLMLVAQPAEEVGGGAKAMLKEGLFSKYAKPDYVLGLHVSANLPAGKVAVAPGYALANVDSVDITVKGKGGHGAYPHTTIDPVVIASRLVLALQTITSREISPLKPSVITVGSIHGGSKHNVISDEVKLQLTLRSYDPEVRDQQVATIKRMAKGIALSAGLPDELMPSVYVHEEERIPSTYNEPELAVKVKASIETAIGQSNVEKSEPVMAGEDFGLYGRTDEHVPITIFWLGAVEPTFYTQSVAAGKTLPSLHSSKFAPDYPLTIKTGVTAMTQSALDLFNQQ